MYWTGGWHGVRSPADHVAPLTESAAPSAESVLTRAGSLDNYTPDDGDEPPQLASTLVPRLPVAPAPVGL